jgi:dipeptidyl aminopeptidase/acylaminoacyl peptidase
MPRTTAERTDYKATTRYQDVVTFCETLAKQFPCVRYSTFGVSGEGRTLPLLMISDPPADPRQSSKPVVLLVGNIHAGEVDGKEALMTFARDIASGSDKALLKELVILIVPILNADGNERIASGKRPEQAGPDEVGDRENAGGLDLNRDFVKLESPEVRALVKLARQWNPAVVVDTHTTNGSKHRHTLTYDSARHPNIGDKRLAFTSSFITKAADRLKAATGIEPFTYGSFSKDRTQWETYPAQPRYGVQYFGLRGRIGVLSESYSYAPFAERVRASHEFARAICQEAAENASELSRVVNSSTSASRVAIRTRLVPDEQPRTVMSFDEDGITPREVNVRVVARVEPTLEVLRPIAYVIAPGFPAVVENLQRHGIELSEVREDIEVDAEVYRVNHVEKRAKSFQGHEMTQVDAVARKEVRRVPAGSFLVGTSQPLGTLASLLLEPMSEDGLTTWNFFDSNLKDGSDFPVARLLTDANILTCRPRPLADERTMNKPIEPGTVLGRSPPLNFSGSPTRILDWLDDERFLQIKDGTCLQVNARSGRGEPFVDSGKIAASLRACSDIDDRSVDRISRQQFFRTNENRTAALLDHNGSYYLLNFDGSPTRKLTFASEGAEFPSFSPDGGWLAFVRNGNLFVAEPFIQMARPLTTDGGGAILNGRADWVYEEEIFNRNGQAYWWSPDSKYIAFLRFDDSPVSKFTLVNHLPTRLKVDEIPYPKAGDPNPIVKVGIVDVERGTPHFVELPGYDPTDTLIARVGWVPGSESVYIYVQNRIQTWLDVCVANVDGGPARKLFRDTTAAWVDDTGPLTYLGDMSFLYMSDRNGWRHIYRYSAEGKFLNAVTKGEWEVEKIQYTDGEWVYFSTSNAVGTRSDIDKSIDAKVVCRVRMDGSAFEILTSERGTHAANMSPQAKLFVDTFSTLAEPTKVVLRDSTGKFVRNLDTNPVYAREEYRFGRVEPVDVPVEGFTLSGTITYPPNFETTKKYPVWMRTYAGPHSPTVADSWMGGRIDDQILAGLGIVVFRVDPRSASGKGRQSAFTAYKQLGVQELKDLEGALDWIAKNPWVDASRIGLQGHSYGGYITAYALTHSKKFAAGISGAPVTDWRNYDSIYTERFLGLPKDNPAGYDAGSVVKAAKNLHGRLLLIHGLMDDNVHVQNTVQLIQELQKADKDFEVMVYPLAQHGIHGRHYQRQLLKFIASSMGVPFDASTRD